MANWVEALGVNLDSADIAAWREAFEEARTALTAAAETKLNLEIMAAWVSSFPDITAPAASSRF